VQNHAKLAKERKDSNKKKPKKFSEKKIEKLDQFLSQKKNEGKRKSDASSLLLRLLHRNLVKIL
jgi:hypothetical protein